METTLDRSADRRVAGILTVGFGATVAMWAVGYAGRLPAVMLPSPVLLGLLLLCPLVAGMVLGRRADLGWAAGGAAGAVAGLLNLLVLGSFLTGPEPNRLVPSALWWIPGSLAVTAALAAAGAAAATHWLPPAPRRDWSPSFARVAVVATMLLLAVGGLVTSAEAGLAVVDWPNSFGYNMFLYPFSRMTGGIYYEHAHRLFGALVGVTTLVLAVFLQRVEPRRWVSRIGWAAFGMVVLQGVLGGLRVTGRLTLSQSPADTSPSLVLALVHGVFGQVFLATLVALAVFTSPTWRKPPSVLRRPGVSTDRRLGGLLVGLLVGQLVLGASQRHLDSLLLFHIVFGVAAVAPLAVHLGFRAWGLNRGQPLLQRLGLALLAAIGLQVLLGLGALAATGAVAGSGAVGALDLALATAHQWFGAALLTLAVMLACWSHRLLAPAGDPGSPD